VTALVRRAGTGRLIDGAILTWSLADGRRGRRWRAVTTLDAVITHALLLEVDLDGRTARLELTTPVGLLTLHPDQDGTNLHGNVVGAQGVRHIALPWSDAHGLSVDGGPIADAATAHRLAGTCGVGDSVAIGVVAIAPDLSIRAETVRFERAASGTWRIAGPTGERTMAIDPRGIPTGLAGAEEWPLELD
jgi:hypothetical protein